MSDIHVTRELLRAVARGDLPSQAMMEYGYKHLMGLCGVCREEFSAFQREQTVKSDVNVAFQALSAVLQRHDQDPTRAGFVEEGAGYDAAMVSIDLATIYTQQGRADEALRVAEEMHVVFKAEDVHREAVAALLLFQEAARQKALTVEKLRDLSEYLKAARGNPSLRFMK